MAGRSRSHYFSVYGLSLRSNIPLGYPEGPRRARDELAIVNVSEPSFRKLVNGACPQTSNAWFEHACLGNGSTYLRWKGLSEFLVSADGSRITYCPVGQIRSESVHTYLLAQVLSYALLKKEIETLHATVVVVDGQAIGFLGDTGHGKSTLAASFLQLGHRLLTDDLLVIRRQGDTLWAYAGPARIKLFPGTARRLLGGRVTGVPMNPGTSKLVIALPGRHVHAKPVPLRALYVLPARSPFRRNRSIRIRKLSPRSASIQLLRNTFNSPVVDSQRLQQQFDFATLHASMVPVKKLSYSRSLASLPAVRDAVLADLARML